MLTADDLDDIKQIVVTTVGQTEARLMRRMYGMDARFDALEQKMDDGLLGIADAIEALNQRLDDHISDPDAHRPDLQPQAA